MGSSRKERLAGRIKQEVSSILLSELHDPRMGFTTVTGVELSSDLRRAKIKVSVLGDEKLQSVTMNALIHAAGYVQRLLASKMKTRYTPSIGFEVDESIKRSVSLSKALRESRESQEDKNDTGKDEY